MKIVEYENVMVFVCVLSAVKNLKEYNNTDLILSNK